MIERLLALQRDGGRAVVLTVVEGDGVGSKLLVVEGGETRRRRPGRAGRARGRADPRRAQPDARARGPEGLRGGLRPAAAPARLRRGRHRRSARAPARSCSAGRRSSPTRAPSSRRAERIPSADELIVAWPEETFAQVAPDHATAIVDPHPRRQVRPAGARARARERRVLHRPDRRPPQPGEEARAAARGGRRRGGARADRRPVRPRHRRRRRPGDRALDPRRGAGRPERARRRPARAARRSGSTRERGPPSSPARRAGSGRRSRGGSRPTATASCSPT